MALVLAAGFSGLATRGMDSIARSGVSAGGLEAHDDRRTELIAIIAQLMEKDIGFFIGPPKTERSYSSILFELII